MDYSCGVKRIYQTNHRATKDKSSTPKAINDAAKALSAAVAAISGGGDTPITGEIKDIGLTYYEGSAMIAKDTDQYADCFFQIKAGNFVTEVTEYSYFGSWGSAEVSSAMITYIKANCKQDGKYVVTILLYEYDEENDIYVPYQEDGKQVELLVYLVV